MAFIFDSGGAKSATATLASASSEEDGFQFTGLDNVANKSIFFDYSCAADTKFQVRFRYHNGVNFGAWHVLVDEDNNESFEYQVGDAVNYPQSGVCEFQLLRQNFYKEKGMRGFQVQVQRLTGDGDITLTNGMEV